MTDDSDIALIAAQMADLAQVVEEMAKQLQRLLEAAASQQTRVRMSSRTASTLRRVN